MPYSVTGDVRAALYGVAWERKLEIVGNVMGVCDTARREDLLADCMCNHDSLSRWPARIISG